MVYDIKSVTCKYCGREYNGYCCKGNVLKCSPDDPRIKLMEAIVAGNLKKVRKLIHGGFFSYGQSPNYRMALSGYHEHQTPLDIAAEQGLLDIVIELCDSEAEERETALYHAAYRFPLVADYLLENGAKPSNNSIRAASSGHQTALLKRMLTINGNDNYSDAMVEAVYNGYTDVVELLLIHGASANARDRMQKPVIYEAIRKGHSDIVNLLLEHGFDPNPSFGEKLLDFAVDETIKDIIKRHGGRSATEKEKEDMERRQKERDNSSG